MPWPSSRAGRPARRTATSAAPAPAPGPAGSTCCGWSARRWMSASVCSTESCTWAAMSARSSARVRACRSSTRSRAMRSHHGPSMITIAAITSRSPASGSQQGLGRMRPVSRPARPMISSRTAATSAASRGGCRRGSARPSTRIGQAAAAPRARPAGVFRQISVRPTTLITSAHATEPSQRAPSAEAMTSTMTSSDPSPAASARPRRSFSARLAMLPSAPSAGSSSQATT